MSVLGNRLKHHVFRVLATLKENPMANVSTEMMTVQAYLKTSQEKLDDDVKCLHRRLDAAAECMRLVELQNKEK